MHATHPQTTRRRREGWIGRYALLPSLPIKSHAAIDPFDADQADPLKTDAIDSSIWELTSMRTHYLASVSTLAKIFQEQLTKPNYNMDDFLDHAYTSVSTYPVLLISD